MSYEVALNKAWEGLGVLTKENNHSVKFMADEYAIDVLDRRVLSSSCNVAAPQHIAILILHYLKVKLQALPQPANEWMSFKEIPESLGYYPAFHKRVITPILNKYGSNPKGLIQITQRFPAREVAQADAAIVVDVFSGVPMMVELWRGDDEFQPEANVLFDKSILKIFCVEDIVVLAEFLAHSL